MWERWVSGRVETWEETDEEARVVQYKISGIGGRGGEREREREREREMGGGRQSDVAVLGKDYFPLPRP